MRNLRLARLSIAVLLLALPALASAAVRPWISGSIGGSTYTMGDVNDDIGAINVELAGTGLVMDDVKEGFNFGLAFGLDVGSGFAVGVGYDRLTGNTEVGDLSASLEYDLPANLVRGFGRYTFESAGNVKGFLEASLGSVISAGSISLTVTGVGSSSGDLEGSGLALEGGGGVSIQATPMIAFTGMAGYRHASVDQVELDGIRIYDTSGGEYTIDYSGLFLRLGMTVALAR